MAKRKRSDHHESMRSRADATTGLQKPSPVNSNGTEKSTDDDGNLTFATPAPQGSSPSSTRGKKKRVNHDDPVSDTADATSDREESVLSTTRGKGERLNHNDTDVITTPTPGKRQRFRQAVKITRSAATKAIIQRNATESPLMRLPGEIRDRIFRLVVGDRLIHLQLSNIAIKDKGFIYHNVCLAKQSEDEAYQQYVGNACNEDQAKEYSEASFQERHAHCNVWAGNLAPILFSEGHMIWTAPEEHGPHPIGPKMALGLLGACRQAYEEANFLLWTTNTFSFQDATTLQMFIKSLNSTQRVKLTAIQIEKTWKSPRTDDWTKVISPGFVKSLKGLKTLHVTFVDLYGTMGNKWDAVGDPQAQGRRIREMRISDPENTEPLYALKGLNLQHVTTMVVDYAEADSYQMKIRDLIGRKERAEHFRKTLLDPKGQEIFAKEVEAEKQKVAAHRENMKRLVSQIVSSFLSTKSQKHSNDA